MSFQCVNAVYQKEMLEISRDRRTLISMVLMPVVVMPLLFSMIGRFAASSSQDAERDAAKIAISPGLIPRAVSDALKSGGLALIEKANPRSAVEAKEVAAGISASGTEGEEQFEIYLDKTRQASEIAGEKASVILGTLKDETVRNSLRGSGVSEKLLTPFTVTSVNVASEKKMGGFIFGTSIGYVVVILMVTGTLYPAVDTAAGEKERRTLEALICSPAPRNDLVMGKILACATASFITGVLALAAMLYSYKSGSMKALMGGKVSFDILDPAAIGLVFVCVIPLAMLFASLMVAISFFAKSYKEGQSYLTPLLLVVIFPAVLGMLPGMELTPLLALIPVFNVCQVIKALFLGNIPGLALAITCGSNLVYAGLAYLFAVRVFRAEGVLFRV